MIYFYVFMTGSKIFQKKIHALRRKEDFKRICKDGEENLRNIFQIKSILVIYLHILGFE